MKYSTLAIHCASLCCDVLQREDFSRLSHEDINCFYKDVYELITQRIKLWPHSTQREHEYIEAVTLGVLKALHICIDNTKARNATWLLQAMQSRIRFTYKRLYSSQKSTKHSCDFT